MNAEKNERIFKEVRGKGQIAYTGKPIKNIQDFRTEALKTRSWADVIQIIKEQKEQPRLLCPTKFSLP